MGGGGGRGGGGGGRSEWASRRMTLGAMLAVSFVVFSFLDVLDMVLCLVYKLVDYAVEAEWKPCYCSAAARDGAGPGVGAIFVPPAAAPGPKVVRLSSSSAMMQLEDVSDTLYVRPSLLSDATKKAGPAAPTLTVSPAMAEIIRGKIDRPPRQALFWSDCDCKICQSWSTSSGPSHLYVHVQAPPNGGGRGETTEDVVFIHGFISSSANGVAAEGNYTPRPAFAVRSGEFILDSGASCHATSDMNLLVDFTPAPQTGCSVRVANGSRLPILGHGSVRLQDSVTLPGVLYVPGLAKNIVSVSRLGELDYNVTFSSTRCFIWKACDGTVVGEGWRVNGLFQLDYLRVPLGRARCAACVRLGSE